MNLISTCHFRRCRNHCNGLLGRCDMGNFNVNLKNQQKWAVSTWRNALGINRYEMGGCTLFEFPNKHMAEHILQGEWGWKHLEIHLEW